MTLTNILHPLQLSHVMLLVSNGINHMCKMEITLTCSFIMFVLAPNMLFRKLSKRFSNIGCSKPTLVNFWSSYDCVTTKKGASYWYK